MKAVVRKKFIDKHTGTVYEAGSLLDITPERYEEIRETDADLVIAVADEPGAADQSTAEDPGAEKQEADQKPKKSRQQTKSDS